MTAEITNPCLCRCAWIAFCETKWHSPKRISDGRQKDARGWGCGNNKATRRRFDGGSSEIPTVVARRFELISLIPVRTEPCETNSTVLTCRGRESHELAFQFATRYGRAGLRLERRNPGLVFAKRTIRGQKDPPIWRIRTQTADYERADYHLQRTDPLIWLVRTAALRRYWVTTKRTHPIANTGLRALQQPSGPILRNELCSTKLRKKLKCEANPIPRESRLVKKADPAPSTAAVLSMLHGPTTRRSDIAYTAVNVR